MNVLGYSSLAIVDKSTVIRASARQMLKTKVLLTIRTHFWMSRYTGGVKVNVKRKIGKRVAEVLKTEWTLEEKVTTDEQKLTKMFTNFEVLSW